MSRYDATITVDCASPDAIAAIYDAINTDESFYPENPVKTEVNKSDGSKSITITASSDNMAHLRANLNSTLRLVQAAHAAITESSKTGSKNS